MNQRRERIIVIGVSILIAIVLLIVYVLPAAVAACDTYNTKRLDQMPARCAAYFEGEL